MLCPYRSVRCLETEGHGVPADIPVGISTDMTVRGTRCRHEWGHGTQECVRHICRLRFHAAGCTLPFEKDVLREILLAAETVRFGSGGKLQRRQGGRCLHTLGWLDASSPSYGVDR